VAPFVQRDEEVLVGLPDTVWLPGDGFAALPADALAFLLFPVEDASAFDAVVTDDEGRVREIQVKRADAESRWIWGAFRMPGSILHALDALWRERERADEYFGTLVNAWLARGGRAEGVRAGRAYVDVGTLAGYRAAAELLARAADDRRPAVDGCHVSLSHRLAPRLARPRRAREASR
jgi:dTDP-glucose pyrophosphorylase